VNLSDNERRVIEVIRAVFANKGLEPPELAADTVLDRSLGLESIDFAELVLRLEREFGEDPFAEGDVPAIRTIHDLAGLYPA
jgi:acyl carrier protein